MRKDLLEIVKEKLSKGQINRRDALKAFGFLAGGALAMKAGVSWADEKQVTVATWGGDGTKAMEEFFFKPFTEQTGVVVRSDGSGPSEGAVQAQAESGKVTWDVMALEYFSAITLGGKGYLGKIDYDIVKKEHIQEGGWSEYGVAAYYNAYPLVYNAKKYGDNPPKTWADFFDVEKFPGKRTIPKVMTCFLEAALLADGVKPEDLYPIDVDRAFKKIEALMPHVVSVWGSGAESQQLMLDGEADMGMLWGSRAILIHRDSGGDVTFTFNDAFVTPDAWGYMKDGPGAAYSNQLIAAMQDPAHQVEVMKLVGVSPANPLAAALVPDEMKPFDCMQPDHVKVSHMLDQDWYAKNYAAVLDRFLALVAG